MNLTPEHPYYSLGNYCREQFGEKTFRVALSLHRECPNRIGDKNGCIFCLPESYEPPTASNTNDISKQLDNGIKKLSAMYGVNKFIAYLQSGSNTYGPVDELALAYKKALDNKNVAALSISTRPDYLSDDILKVISNLTLKHKIWVELGIQTCHDKSLEFLKRGHNNAASLLAINKLKDIGVEHIVAHMILGLPGESEEQMHQSFKIFSDSQVDGFKIHHLQIIKGTHLAKMWRENKIETLTFNQYCKLVVNIIEHIPSNIVLHRLFGSAHEKYLLAPLWNKSRAKLLQQISLEFKSRQSYQGILTEQALT